MPLISEGQFREMVRRKLQRRELKDSWRRSLRIFRGYGVDWGFDVTLALLYAASLQKVETVLLLLEEHYTIYEYEIYPETTQKLFDHIRVEVLSLPSMRPAS